MVHGSERGELHLDPAVPADGVEQRRCLHQVGPCYQPADGVLRGHDLPDLHGEHVLVATQADGGHGERCPLWRERVQCGELLPEALHLGELCDADVWTDRGRPLLDGWRVERRGERPRVHYGVQRGEVRMLLKPGEDLERR